MDSFRFDWPCIVCIDFQMLRLHVKVNWVGKAMMYSLLFCTVQYTSQYTGTLCTLSKVPCMDCMGFSRILIVHCHVCFRNFAVQTWQSSRARELRFFNSAAGFIFGTCRFRTRAGTLLFFFVCRGSKDGKDSAIGGCWMHQKAAKKQFQWHNGLVWSVLPKPFWLLIRIVIVMVSGFGWAKKTSTRVFQ